MMRGVTLAVSVCATLAAAPSGTPADPSINGVLLAQRLPRIEYLGGPVVRSPHVVTVTFAGEDPGLVARLEQFGNTVTQTSWWRAVVEGYCVNDGDCIGDGQPGVSVRLDDALPAWVHAVELSALLIRHAKAGRLGPLDSESVLLVYLPDDVSLSDAFVERYCHGPRAFHRPLRFDGKIVGYAAIPRCGDETALTATASHELVETVMNPDTARPGFAFVQDSTRRAFTAAGNEAMDPCGFMSNELDTVEGTFVVRRSWSNQAASMGRDPCVPAADERAYVALVPRQPTVRLTKDGETVTIDLDAAADRAVARWAVSAFDLTGAQEGTRYVDVALDNADVRPGETVGLRITRLAPHPKQVSVVGVVSTIDGHSHLWPVAVVTR